MGFRSCVCGGVVLLKKFPIYHRRRAAVTWGKLAALVPPRGPPVYYFWRPAPTRRVESELALPCPSPCAPPHPVKRTLCAYSATESSGTILMVRHKRRRAGPGVLMGPRPSRRRDRRRAAPGCNWARATVEAAARRGRRVLKAAKALDLASKVASHGLSPFARASLAETAALKCVKALLDKGADVDMSIEERWPTALCCAAGSGQFQAVQLLVENGAKTEGALICRVSVGSCKTLHRTRTWRQQRCASPGRWVQQSASRFYCEPVKMKASSRRGLRR